MNNNQPLNSKITTIHLFTLAVQVIWGKIAKIKTYYIEACRLPSKSGTNVKSVETALGTWGSYHLYIYIFYISQEISSLPFSRLCFLFSFISISLSSEIWASHFHSIRTSASLEKTTESYVGSPQNSLPAKSCQLREILIHIPNKPCKYIQGF